MAKKQEKAAHDETVKQQGASNENYNSLRTANTAGTKDPEIYGGYKSLADTGGISDEERAGLLGTVNGNYGANSGGSSGGGSGSGGGGGAKVNDYYAGISPLDTHGFDDAENAFKKMDPSKAQHFADTGGLDDPAQLERMRGLGVYDEFAKTGGYSDSDLGNIRAKSLAPISAFDTNMRNDMASRRNVQGGYAPGFDASSRALKRDTARNISDTSRDTEIALKDKVNTGRLAGAAGAAQSEGNIAQLKTQNQLEGQRQVSQIQEAVASGMMSAAQGRAQIAAVQQQTDLAIASGRTQRDIAEMQLAASNGNAAAARELAKMQMDAQNKQFLMQLESSNKLAGLGGMNSVYQTGMDRGLSIDNSQAGANVNFGGLRSDQANQIGGPWDAVKDGIGMATGVASAFMGGGGATKPVTTKGNTGITGLGTFSGEV
jgi:hypothetical protein